MSAPALTDEQEQAVGRRGEALLLSAAAGSGKTSVLVERFVAAVREDGVAPARILAITFTERAAGELRGRVRARLLGLGERQAARDTEAAFIGTFHAFCARLLRSHALAAGVDPTFSILDESLAGRLRGRAFSDALRELAATESEELLDLLAAYNVDRVRAIVEDAYAELRSRGQLRPRLPQVRGEEPAVRACALLDVLLERFGEVYERSKRERHTLDFDDLELLARELLERRDGLRKSWSERFELLMVDEFQDTNPRQLGILRALDRGNLFTVGDELQSIYGFRHADVTLFRERRAELERTGASLLLTRNFRSREELLGVVNTVFAERFDGYVPLRAGRASLDEDAARLTPAMRDEAAPTPPLGAEEPAVELLLTDVRGWEREEGLVERLAAGLPPAQPWRHAEARVLAQRIGELVRGGGARAGEVVVLVRALGDLDVFAGALRMQGLRTLAAVGGFWRHQQVADLVSYLRALANPLDELALHSVLASPLAGCSLDCLALLARGARASGRGLLAAAEGAQELEAAIPERDRVALAGFCARLRAEREAGSRRALGELIEHAIDGAGYRGHVLALDGGERRLANVHKLLRLARRFEAAEGRDLRAFLDHVEHLQNAAAAEPDAPVEGVEPDAVRLMTVHAAKGLEFPVVCVADLGRQPNTQTPDLLLDAERVGLRLVTLDGAGSTPTLDYESLCRERREREAQEEDRILYVAMTRARERLLLSGAVDFARWPAARQAPTAISWLAPALSPEIPALAGERRSSVRDVPVGGAAASVRCRFNSPATTALELAPERPPDPPSASVVPTTTLEAPGAPAAPATAPAAGEQLSLAFDAAPASPPAEARERGRPLADGASSGAPAPEEALPSALSYTSLSELERCGYRFYLERVLGLPEERPPAAAAAAAREEGLEARARGTLVHRLLETYDFARPSALDAERVASVAAELALRVSERERAELAALMAGASAAAPAVRLAQARRVWREHPFAFSLGADAPLIGGVIDLLAQEADGTHLIVDYKSDRVEEHADLAALVEREYLIQRELYALALLRDGARAVEVLHWFLERPAEPVSARFEASGAEELEDRLRSRLARATVDPFRVSADPHRALCQTCPGRASLCSWSEAGTLRESPGAGLFDSAFR